MWLKSESQKSRLKNSRFDEFEVLKPICHNFEEIELDIKRMRLKSEAQKLRLKYNRFDEF